MIKYSDLSEEQTLEVTVVGTQYSTEHPHHVDLLIHFYERDYGSKAEGVAPSGSDLFRPELWKGCHWVWFFKCKL